MSVLRLGDQGPDVRKLQLLLNSTLVPNPHLIVDGDFGKKTEQAVVTFQHMRGLPEDGIVGQRTWALLGQTFSVGSRPRMHLTATG
jgi:peptidoglycan hydrolase-like protein with peptidoglycan-binding domain